MRIKFYLKRPKSKSETTLYALVNYNSNTLKIYTGESILPKYWNPDTNEARNTEKFSEHPQFNQRLARFKSIVNKIYIDYKNDHNDHEPSLSKLKELIDKAFEGNKNTDKFIGYFEDYVKRTFNGKRVAKRNGQTKIIGEGVARGCRTTLIHLKRFSETWDRELDFDNIDLGFHEDFTEFLTVTGTAIHPRTKKVRPLHLSANSVGGHFQRIKAVLNEATERGINKNMAFNGKNFIKQSEDAETIYLNDDELKELYDLDLSNNDRLDNIRDLFLIGAYTGLRFSDFSTLKPENITNNRIRITQTKTGDPVIIPLHKIVKEILAKRNGLLPRSITNEKMNLFLKELGAMTKSLNNTISKTSTKGGSLVTVNVEKWKLLTSHTCRRSFSSNWYKKGVPSLTIMAITGHKTEKSFLKYIRVSPEEHANIFQMYMDKEENKLKAV